MEVALDAKNAAGRAAALQHHMHVKRIHQNRVAAPSSINNSSTSTFMDKGLRYRLYDDPLEQSFAEDYFYTIEDPEAEIMAQAELQGKVLKKPTVQPAWVPSRSTHTYVKTGAKREVQLEKFIPTVTTKTDDLNGLLSVAKFQNQPTQGSRRLNRSGDSAQHQEYRVNPFIDPSQLPPSPPDYDETYAVTSPSSHAHRSQNCDQTYGHNYALSGGCRAPPRQATAAWAAHEDEDDAIYARKSRSAIMERDAALDRDSSVPVERHNLTEKALITRHNVKPDPTFGREPQVESSLRVPIEDELDSRKSSTDIEPPPLPSYLDHPATADAANTLTRSNRWRARSPSAQQVILDELQRRDKALGELILELQDEEADATASARTRAAAASAAGLGAGEAAARARDMASAANHEASARAVEERRVVQGQLHEIRLREKEDKEDVGDEEDDGGEKKKEIMPSEAERKQWLMGAGVNEVAEDYRQSSALPPSFNQSQPRRELPNRSQSSFHQPPIKASHSPERFRFSGSGGDRPVLPLHRHTMAKILPKVRAALYGTNPRSLFLRHNRDKSGFLDLSDFKRLVRTSLKVSPRDLGDDELATFATALDRDGDGLLSLNELLVLATGGIEDFEFVDPLEKKQSLSMQGPKSNRGRAKPKTAAPMPLSSSSSSATTAGAAHHHSNSSHGFTITGGNPYHVHKVTTPAPFQSMEMDTVMRQHKVYERERAKSLEAEQKALKQERRFKASQQAQVSEAQLRLAQNQNALRLQREAAAEAQTAAALAQKQFKARQYKGDGGLEWREIAEAQEVERAQRIATRASKLAATCKPPRMVAREEAKEAQRSHSRSRRSLSAPRSEQGRGRGGGAYSDDDDDEECQDDAGSSKRGLRKSVGGSRGRSAPRDATRSYDDGNVTARSSFKSPEEVRASLTSQRAAWDRKDTIRRETLKVDKEVRVATLLEPDAMVTRQEQYNKQQAERAAKKEAQAQEEAARARAAEARAYERAMRVTLPDQPRSTRAAALKIKAIRDKQAMLEKEAAREAAREKARTERRRAAAKEIRPALQAFDKERSCGDHNDNDGADDSEPSLKEKMRLNREALEAKVSSQRPSLMERMSAETARDKARAAALRAMGSTLQEVYGGDGKGVGVGSARNNKEKWLQSALSDGLLDAEEVEYLKLTQPNSTMSAGFGEKAY